MPDPDAVYDVLVREAGAHPNGRGSFFLRIASAGRGGVYVAGLGCVYHPRTNTVTDCNADTIRRTNAALAALEEQ